MAAASDITARRFSRSGGIGSGMAASNKAPVPRRCWSMASPSSNLASFIGVVAHGSVMDKARSGRDRLRGSFLRQGGDRSPFVNQFYFNLPSWVLLVPVTYHWYNFDNMEVRTVP